MSYRHCLPHVDLRTHIITVTFTNTYNVPNILPHIVTAPLCKSCDHRADDDAARYYVSIDRVVDSVVDSNHVLRRERTDMTQQPAFLNVISSHSNATNTSKFWWKVRDAPEDDDLLYASFSVRDPNKDALVRAATQAAASKNRAVQVLPTGAITETSWVDPFGDPFNAPDHIPRIRRDDLAIIRQIKPGVDVVNYGGNSFVHKYMTYFSEAFSFEIELANYAKAAGSQYIPNLCYIVTHKDVNRGMLIEYLPSESLHNVLLAPSEKYAASAYLLDALSDLETREYYPQDLKLPNILFSRDRRMVHIVDLGTGVTEGMYREGSEWRLLHGNANSRDICYAFGKTLLYLFSEEDSDEESEEKAIESLPPLIRTIVVECCGDQLEQDIRVDYVRRKYGTGLLELAGEF